MTHSHCFSFLCRSLVYLAVAVAAADAWADWPQWRGPQRDGHAAPQTLLQQWPEGGPKVKWQFADTGRGYSTVAVVGDRVFTLGARGENCYAICLSLATGEKVWETVVSRASSQDDYNHGWGGGPRSTPTVDGEQIFVLSDVGVLASLNKADGKLQWSTHLVNDHGGGIPVWGYSESPLVDGDRVIVTPGSSQFMIGVDRHSGKKVWGSKNTDAPAQYCSVQRGTVGGKKYYVTASKPGLMAFDAETGEKLFSDSATGNDVAVIPTPLIVGDYIYHTSDYGAGNTLLKLEASDGGIKAESVYALNDQTMQNHHGGVVLVDGVIYGFTKANGGTWMAQDFESGKKLWEERVRPNRSGAICYADGRLYCYNDEDGSVILVEPSGRGWQARGQLTLPRQTDLPRDKGAIWAHPVVAHQTLLIRDQDLLFAFDLAP